MMQGSAATEEVQRMQLREERLQATKESVQTGEVGLHKEVVTELQSIDVPHEEVYIERRAGSGQVLDQPRGQDGESIRVPMSAEQVNVTKQTLDTGEVAIGKGQVQGTKQVSDSVSHDEDRIDREGDMTIEGMRRLAQRQ